MKRSADDIFRRSVSAVEDQTPDRTVNVILLHDGGGDRSQTIEALPKLIETLRGHGYQFISVAELLGRTRDQVRHRLPLR